MLHVIVGILKVTGIIAGFLLLFVFAVLAAVLLVPLRYRVKAVKEPEQIFAEVQISWFLHIVNVILTVRSLSDRTVTVRLFGKELPLFRASRQDPGREKPDIQSQASGSGKSGTAQPEETSPEQREPAESEPMQTEPGQPEPERTSPEQREPAESESMQTEPGQPEPERTGPEQREPAESESMQQESGQSEPERTGPEQREPAESESMQTESGQPGAERTGPEQPETEPESERTEADRKQPEPEQAEQEQTEQESGSFSKIQFQGKRIRDKIRQMTGRLCQLPKKLLSLWEKAGELSGKLAALARRPGQLLELAEQYEVKEIAKGLYGRLAALLLHYRPRRIRGYLKFGTGDPASTGQVTGLIYLLLPARADCYDIVPDFYTKMFETETVCEGYIRAVHALNFLLCTVCDKRVRKLIKKLRKRGKGNG